MALAGWIPEEATIFEAKKACFDLLLDLASKFLRVVRLVMVSTAFLVLVRICFFHFAVMFNLFENELVFLVRDVRVFDGFADDA